MSPPAVDFQHINPSAADPLQQVDHVRDLDFWTPGLGAPEPSWLLGEDFDLAAFNASISAAVSSWSNQNTAGDVGDSVAYNPDPDLRNAPGTVFSAVPPLIHEMWHTRPAPEAAPQATSKPSQDQDVVDESYRANLSQRLKPRLYDDMLPSAQFLVSPWSALPFSSRLIRA